MAELESCHIILLNIVFVKSCLSIGYNVKRDASLENEDFNHKTLFLVYKVIWTVNSVVFEISIVLLLQELSESCQQHVKSLIAESADDYKNDVQLSTACSAEVDYLLFITAVVTPLSYIYHTLVTSRSCILHTHTHTLATPLSCILHTQRLTCLLSFVNPSIHSLF